MLEEVDSFQRNNLNMRVVVIEPTCVFGPRGRSFVRDPVEQISAGRFYLIEHGCGMFNGIYIDNLVDALLRAASNGGPSQLRYIVNEEEVTATSGIKINRLSKEKGEIKELFQKRFPPLFSPKQVR